MRILTAILLVAVLVAPSFTAAQAQTAIPDLLTLKTQAAQGNARAQYSLGLRYATGRGVPQDNTKARQWFEKSAAQGNARAQYSLGMLYDTGQGVPQDYVRAYVWYKLAAASLTGEHQKNATGNRDNIARLLTPAQLAEGQRLASQCQARQFKGC